MSSRSTTTTEGARRSRPRTLWTLLLVSLALVIGGGSFAAAVQTDFGGVSVKDLRFTGQDGQTLSALLYIPKGVTAERPAPGILAVHGYINSRETQDGFAIELSRRGYVVLALDQSGHGFSGGAAFQNGYGGPAALAYLHSLDIVDPNNIGLEGHSMGGWTVVSAAAAHPDFYSSMVLEGSSTGGGVAPNGSPTFPKNLKIVYGQHEEFSQLMWNTADPKNVQSSAKMEALFGTDQPIVAGRVYGSVADGNARVIQRPDTTHPGLTISPTAIRYAVDWFGQTLNGARPAGGQIWWLKELSTGAAFVGGVIFLFAFGGLLLRSRFFGTLSGRPTASVGIRSGLPWYGSALLTAIISAVTYFPFQIWGNDWLPANSAFPQNITTGVMFWALGNALISLVLFAVWHGTAGRRAGGGMRTYGLTGAGSTPRLIGKSAVLATVIAGGLYGLLAFSYWAFRTDFRYYVFNLHLLDAERFRIFLVYLVPFAVFSTVIATVLNSQLRPAEAAWSTGRRMVANGTLLAIGILALIVIDYIPLLAGGRLWISGQPLLIIVAYQFVPLLFVIGMLVTFFSDRTGTVYTGAFLSAILISWLNVAGTANQAVAAPWGTGNMIVRAWLPLAAAVLLLVAAVLRRGNDRGGSRHVAGQHAAGSEEQPSARQDQTIVLDREEPGLAVPGSGTSTSGTPTSVTPTSVTPESDASVRREPGGGSRTSR